MEEYSRTSYMQKPTDDPDQDQSPDEESGWTTYFEDFSNYMNNRSSQDHHQDDEDEENCSYGSPSLISDAASAAAWKLSQNRNNLIPGRPSIGGFSKTFPKKLKFKKTRTKEICDDDSLEDTASSPVNSPKVSDFEAVDMNISRKGTDDHMQSSLGKEASSEHYYSPEMEIKADNRSMNNNFNGKNDCTTDLKSRGLCLVPMSMLVNYYN